MPTFPTVSLLDSFKRAEENPLNNSGKWKIINGFPGAGKIGATESYEGNTGSFGEASTAYWTPEEFSEPGAIAEYTGEFPAENRTAFVWACLQTPTTSNRSGYGVRIVYAGLEAWNFQIIKMVKGVISVLSEEKEKHFEQGDWFGISVAGGKIYSWRKKGAGEIHEIGNATDATWTSGFVGVGINGNGTEHLHNFEAGNGEEPAPEVENPGTQHSNKGEAITPLKIKATHTTEYKATGLPAGLSINAGTGEITGTPTTLESPKVKIKVKGAGGEASMEFEWVIEEGGSSKKNKTYTLL